MKIYGTAALKLNMVERKQLTGDLQFLLALDDKAN